MYSFINLRYMYDIPPNKYDRTEFYPKGEILYHGEFIVNLIDPFVVEKRFIMVYITVTKMNTTGVSAIFKNNVATFNDQGCRYAFDNGEEFKNALISYTEPETISISLLTNEGFSSLKYISYITKIPIDSISCMFDNKDFINELNEYLQRMLDNKQWRML